jgi:hypothetical protein
MALYSILLWPFEGLFAFNGLIELECTIKKSSGKMGNSALSLPDIK